MYKRQPLYSIHQWLSSPEDVRVFPNSLTCNFSISVIIKVKFYVPYIEACFSVIMIFWLVFLYIKKKNNTNSLPFQSSNIFSFLMFISVYCVHTTLCLLCVPYCTLLCGIKKPQKKNSKIKEFLYTDFISVVSFNIIWIFICKHTIVKNISRDLKKQYLYPKEREQYRA